MPFVGIHVLVASTALAAAQGDLDSTGAKVTAAVAAVTTIGLSVSAWRGLRTDQVVGQALEEGLGTGWRDRVHVPLRRHRPWARILLLSALMRRRDVRRIPDISYGEAGRRNPLDVYRRRDAPKSAPVLIYFHGGGYTSGGKNREARPLLYRLASQGWVCISANYRLRPQTTFPGHQIDAKKVIA
ncbi:alpha/beta hydrolase [Streptomyces sp. NPDC020731]|uniref:alpha/beta hydrolase n=1 Tax=Streptomyces sp. NPDC020731 TaxID=3365085 RepID=UPI00378EF037